MKHYFLLFVILCFSFKSFPQATFQKAYYPKYGGAAFSVCQTIDHGFLLCGEAEDSNTVASDLSIIKTDADGNLEWEKFFGTLQQQERVDDCVQTTDGGFAVTSWTLPGRLFILKTHADGSMAWVKTFDTLSSGGFAIEKTSDGGVVAGGTKFDGFTGPAYIIKVDADANVQWAKTYAITGQDGVRSISATNDGGFIICFTNNSGTDGMFKIDGDGNFEWGKSFSEPFINTSLYRAEQALDNGYVISGGYNGIDSNYTQYPLIIKTDSLGNMEWAKAYSTGATMYRGVADIASDGGYVISGAMHLPFAEDDAYLIKTDQGGNVVWANSYGSANNDNCYWVAAADDGGFAMAGYSTDSLYHTGAFLFKTDANGNSGCNQNPINVQAGDSFIIETTVTAVVTDVPTYPQDVSFYSTHRDSSFTWCYTPGANCNADFILIPDSFQQGLYWGYNLATGNNLKYFWSWGDGTNSAGQYPDHYYADSGFYNICEMILDTVSLCTDTFCADYTILKTEGMMQIHEINFVGYPLNFPPHSAGTFEWTVYPNPVSSVAAIDFKLSAPSQVLIRLFSLDEREVMTIADEKFSEGTHHILLDRTKLSAGIYFLQLETSAGVQNKKIVVE